MNLGFMKRNNYLLYLIAIVLLLTACKDKETIYPNPYTGGKQALDISFADVQPVPAHASAGDKVTYAVHGLSGYKAEELRVYLHGEKADVLSVSDSTITVEVPQSASTGELSLYLKGQVFFGPALRVDGKVNVDKTFIPGNGANRLINEVLEMPSSNLLLVGAFTDYDLNAVNQPINRIAMTTIDGQYLSTLLSGAGANSSIASVAQLSNGKYIIGGSFTRFNDHTGTNFITRLNANGSLDTMIVSVVNITPEDPTKGVDTVPAFNGGVSGDVVKVFTHDDAVIAVGNFTSYGSYFYETSTYDTKILDETDINQLVRMDQDGKMDSTYNFNKATGKPFAAGNGEINDALMFDDGSLLVVGGFTKFDNQDAGRIVKIGTNGLPVASFNTGAGADDEVKTVQYNAVTQKILITGLFRHFNEQEFNGVVMLNKDGSVDPTFRLGKLEGGRANFAAQLSNGLIIISGSFKKYNGITRNGFMILNPDGSLAEGYNNTGDFQGQVRDIYETKSAVGRPAVLLVGYISRFDGKPAGNIVRLEFQP